MKIKLEEIPTYASLYPNVSEGDDACFDVGYRALVRGYLTKPDFLTITDWKTERVKELTRTNSERNIAKKTTTCFSLSGPGAALPLLQLRGVGLPTASAILHYCHPQDFPIIDYRALWTLDIPHGNTSWKGWLQLCKKTKEIHEETSYDYRTIDRSLWMYSRHHQR